MAEGTIKAARGRAGCTVPFAHPRTPPPPRAAAAAVRLQRDVLADLILVRVNPLEDVANAGGVQVVMKAGIVHMLEEILLPFQPGGEGRP